MALYAAAIPNSVLAIHPVLPIPALGLSVHHYVIYHPETCSCPCCARHRTKRAERESFLTNMYDTNEEVRRLADKSCSSGMFGPPACIVCIEEAVKQIGL